MCCAHHALEDITYFVNRVPLITDMISVINGTISVVCKAWQL